MRKTCLKCDTEKDLKEFSRHSNKKDGRQPYCKECYKPYLAAYYRNNRERIIRQNVKNIVLKKPKVKAYLVEKFGGVCQGCNGTFPDASLHFHHRDPSTKEFQISAMKTASLEKLEREAAKCDMLCQGCHKKAHIELGDLGLRKGA